MFYFRKWSWYFNRLVTEIEIDQTWGGQIAFTDRPFLIKAPQLRV